MGTLRGGAVRSMPLLRLRLLGGFEARIGSKALALPRKGEALLAYLALAPATTHSRSKLAALLWGDTGDDDARNNLRQVLFRMRRVFGRTSNVLTLSGELVGLDRRAVRSDVATFRRLVADGSDEALRSATELCAGHLLDGFDLGEPAFEEWLASERERLQELAIGALLKLCCSPARCLAAASLSRLAHTRPSRACRSRSG